MDSQATTQVETPPEDIAMEYDVKFVPQMYFLNRARLKVRTSITKAGPIALWNQSRSEWTRKFLALRRPYLYLYSSDSEMEIEAVMSVFTLRLDHGERISEMFNVLPLPVDFRQLEFGVRADCDCIGTECFCDLHEFQFVFDTGSEFGGYARLDLENR